MIDLDKIPTINPERVRSGPDPRKARGSRHGRAKLTEEQVRVIRHRGASGERVAAIASDFGVKGATIYDILRRKNWVHVE